MYKRLFLLIEGDDDERFIKRIIVPELAERYDSVQLWKYSQETKKKINSFLRSIKAMNSDYVFLADIDSAPCVTVKKKAMQAKYQNADNDNIMVVIKEIESWYIAGLDKSSSKKLRIPHFNKTDSLTKEQFEGLIPKKFVSRVDFMQETLKFFDVIIARQKNKSFNYFLQKSS